MLRILATFLLVGFVALSGPAVAMAAPRNLPPFAADDEGVPPPKLTPFEECFSQIADERIAACTVVLEHEAHDTATRLVAWINRGVAFGQKGRMGAALDDFERVLAHDPRHVEALANAAIAHTALKEHAQALPFIARAVAIAPHRAPLHALHGNALRDAGEPRAALDAYSRALAIDPAFAFALHGRARARLTLGERTAALADLDITLKLNPVYADAYLTRGKLLVDLGRYEPAVRDFTRAVERRPTFAGAWFNRGRAHHFLKAYGKAIADYDKVLELVPGFAPALDNRARARAALKDWKGALADLDAAIAQGARHVETDEFRAEVQAMLAQP